MNAHTTADRINEKRTAATANNSRPGAGGNFCSEVIHSIPPVSLFFKIRQAHC